MNTHLKVKETAKAHNITITEIALRMGITKGTLSAAINGNPTINYIAKIAEAIGCSPKDLIQ